ncbi:hypothetical protein [Haliangium sp.]|uniref:hypothetical protein n=1 Tax=Haliangium sp. TaxID=2663208 RepID=UPI003D130202
MSANLAERVMALRDEVLDTAERGEPNPLGAEIFDATVRCLASFEATDPGIDLALHDSLSRRLAWGDDEHVVLADANDVCERLLAAAQRALRSAVEEMVVAEAVTQVGCTAARIVATAAVGRAGRDRAMLLREQASLTRLRAASERQSQELQALEDRG